MSGHWVACSRWMMSSTTSCRATVSRENGAQHGHQAASPRHGTSERPSVHGTRHIPKNFPITPYLD
ncbi:hypothetical protein, partial [Saccharopolyspora shandongensis]|uniref:hypothetical protein n=1 Tax=Saccharopolyspora shandongensis TaxID=418495 RepID=UPI0033ED8DB1